MYLFHNLHRRLADTFERAKSQFPLTPFPRLTTLTYAYLFCVSVLPNTAESFY